jgi:hypothetical protein
MHQGFVVFPHGMVCPICATRKRVAGEEESVVAWPRSGHATTLSSMRAGRSPAHMPGETGTHKALVHTTVAHAGLEMYNLSGIYCNLQINLST